MEISPLDLEDLDIDHHVEIRVEILLEIRVEILSYYLVPLDRDRQLQALGPLGKRVQESLEVLS